MRLLHVINSMSPSTGGPAEALRQLARGYKQIGTEVEIVCQDDPGAPFLLDIGAPVHAMGAATTVYGRSPALLEWLKGNVGRFDGVVVEGIWQYFSRAVRQAALGRVPYAVFTHGALDPWFQKKYPLKHLKKYAYWIPFQYPVLRDAKAVLFTTQTERELATISFRPHRWNSIVIPFGTNPPGGDPGAQRRAFYAVCPALEERRFLLFLSRIHEKKGCDLLIEAFAQVAGQYPEVDLVVAGPDQTGLQKMLAKVAASRGIADRVHWPGLLTGEAKWGAFRAAEAFVLPSHQENFGIVVAEALACGTPVLISNKVNIWDVVAEEGVGLVEDDTLEGTHRLLMRWLELPVPARASMAAKTVSCFERRFSMQRCASAMAEIFRNR